MCCYTATLCACEILISIIDFRLFIDFQIGEYLLEKGTYSEQEMANEITLQVLDILLKSEHSINKEKVSNLLLHCQISEQSATASLLRFRNFVQQNSHK